MLQSHRRKMNAVNVTKKNDVLINIRGTAMDNSLVALENLCMESQESFPYTGFDNFLQKKYIYIELILSQSSSISHTNKLTVHTSSKEKPVFREVN